RHWTPLLGAVVVGGACALLIVRAHDFVAPWVMIVYGILSVIAVIGWIQYWFGPVARRQAARFALLLLALYAGSQAIAAVGRKHDVRQSALRRFGSGARWAALTNVGQPYTWEAIYASADTVAGDDWQLPRRLRVPAVQRALQTSDGRAMAQFARFLAAEVDTSEKTVYLRDARYARVSRSQWAVPRVRTE
ncbi:MAG: hypothetical protein ABR537_07400, partial [Gemmatimonadales bacterium]